MAWSSQLAAGGSSIAVSFKEQIEPLRCVYNLAGASRGVGGSGDVDLRGKWGGGEVLETRRPVIPSKKNSGVDLHAPQRTISGYPRARVTRTFADVSQDEYPPL